ncbi:MAG TPA: hypothetical protein VHO68_03860, partial [Bacteroidales bacterium]|nr:hypothetical protein [Bacteroidales bacterium]
TLTTDDEGDIVLKINSTVNWYFGTDGKAGASYDLVTVVLHEICHGLGFYDSMSTEGTNGFYGLGGVPMIYDTFITDLQGQRLTDTLKYHNNSPQLLQKMQNGPLYFKGKVTGNSVKIYTPEVFDEGSSISHLDEASYTLENALMTPYIDKGEAIHDPGLIVRKILGDIGWINTRIIHTALKDTEANLSQVRVDLEIKSDTTYKHDLVGLVYSWNDFATRDTLYLTESATPGQFSVALPVPAYNSGLQYYLFAIDYFSRIYRSPSLISEFRYKAYIGVDTVKPVIIHTPVEYCLQNNDTVSINVAADDNIGIDSVYLEYRINDGQSSFMGLKHGSGFSYSAEMETRKLGFRGGDSVRYRIYALDAAAGRNMAVLPKSDFYKFRVEEIGNPVEAYSTDFSTTAGDFFNVGFSIAKPSGFSHYGLHTKHPYESPETDNGSINYTSMLRYPVKMTSSGILINFDEVVLVEPGETGSLYGSSDFYDFVILEGSGDAGKTWFPLADGYDSRINPEWEKDYNGAITDMNSSYAGTEAMMQKHTIYVAPSEKLKTGDTIMVRFRLYSDPYANGWGWGN